MGQILTEIFLAYQKVGDKDQFFVVYTDDNSNLNYVS
jgi:hypothetical protein|tara:strand:+ start:11507 stop:11617 length:111 start_codon:yes stop_codon:yes gene_type:complete